MKVAFDVDGTLIHQTGDLIDTPRYEVIQLFHLLRKFGCELFIWSGGGVDYAERWAEKLGLADYATIAPKGSFQPDLAVDDMDLDFLKTEGSLGRVNLRV